MTTPNTKKQAPKGKTPKTETKPAFDYVVHPVANVFPMLAGQEWTDFLASIKKTGINQPLVMDGNVLVDGRNRVAAAEELGFTKDQIPTVPFDREKYGDDVAGFIISLNINRRHLSEDQRVTLIAKARAADLSKESAESKAASQITGGKAPGKTGKAKGRTAEKLAAEAGTSVHKAKAAIASVAGGTADAVIAGKQKLAKAAKEAKAKAPKKPAAPKKEPTLAEKVEKSYRKFMEKFAVVDYPAVRAELKKLIAQSEKPPKAA